MTSQMTTSKQPEFYQSIANPTLGLRADRTLKYRWGGLDWILLVHYASLERHIAGWSVVNVVTANDEIAYTTEAFNNTYRRISNIP